SSPHPAPAADPPPALAHHGILRSPRLLPPSPPQRPFSIHHPPVPLPVSRSHPIYPQAQSPRLPPLRYLSKLSVPQHAHPRPPVAETPVGTIDIPFVDSAHIQVRRALCSAAAPVSPFRRMTRIAERSEGGARFGFSDPCDLRGDKIASRYAVRTMVHPSATRSSSPSSAYSLPTKLANVAPML
ncbi:hypothetical protein B0H11DRAFT_1993436, partial [Mycena galericulata]